MARYRLDVSRDSQAHATIPVADDAIIEFELKGGATLWVRADELGQELTPDSQISRGGQLPAGDTVVLPLSYPRHTVQPAVGRGPVAWVLKALNILDVDVAGEAASTLAEQYDTWKMPAPGLYRWQGGALGDRIDDRLAGDAPILLFLHGTFSSTLGSFGAIPDTVWHELRAAYGDRVCALEHRTVSESPVENALAVLEALPDDATLHIVSHSRGGLVGELLCRGELTSDGKARPPFLDKEIELMAADRETVERLNNALRTKRPKVRRFVRVACPARGTVLAGERFDRWLGVLVNLMQRGVTGAAAVAAGPAAASMVDDASSALKDFMLAVVKRRASGEDMPGIAAMVPGSGFQKVINRLGVTSAADLSVIKGDLEGEDILSSLKALVTDLFFREDHDLVVNTSAMDGGTGRVQARTFLDQGADVNHFNYFRNQETARQMLRGLRRDDGDMAGFSLIEAAEAGVLPRAVRSKRSGPGPAVFILPGITGSLLRAGERDIWVNLWALARGGLEKLAITAPSVTATGVFERYYGDLVEYLSDTHEVHTFPYDWRLPVKHEADRLADALLKQLEASDQPVRIVAHSMGGLVARAALGRNEPLRRRFNERRDCRLVMLGTPNGGSYSIPMMLTGRNQMMRMLAALDFTMSSEEHLAIVRRYPGVLDLLPDPDERHDFFRPDTWVKVFELAGTEIPEQDLAQARDFREALNACAIDPDRMFYIAGQNVTPNGVATDADGTVVFTRTQRGDGSVPWDTGIPKGIKVWYTQAAHGDLARHREAFPAILEILQRGETGRLPITPSLPRDLAMPRPIVAEAMEVFPGENDLAAAGLGGRIDVALREERRRRLRPITLRVVHGNLAFARHPVLVGHYAGDTMAGAEAQLDRIHSGGLSRRKSLGLYPGAIATAEVLLDPQSHSRGTVVVGLGDIGKLTSGGLSRTLIHGLLRYAALRQELNDGPLMLSALLVGSGTGGVSLTASVMALLRALLRAQTILSKGFHEIEVIDVYEDRAIQAWHAIDHAIRSTDLSEAFILQPDVQHGEGGRRRVVAQVDPTWWQPLTITKEDVGQEKDIIRFTVPTGTARAEAMVLPTQRALIDQFMRSAILGERAGRLGTPGRALFELLVPHALKDQTKEDRPLRLIVDDFCARYPWELMDDRRPWDNDGVRAPDGQRKPMAVRAGLIRQLIHNEPRERSIRPSGRHSALVIGNPPTGGAYSDLPGAAREAEAVCELLRDQGFRVESFIGRGTPNEMVMALCERDWAVIHIAAHGVVGEQTGIVLGKDYVLNADTLGQLLPMTPGLVFVNCCHLGMIDPASQPDGIGADAEEAALRADRPGLAANIAVELIRIGVGAVVAAGWAVDDSDAETFARVFYKAVLDPFAPATLGEAALRARQDICRNDGSTTWGAYQIYGEPGWRLYPEDIGDEPEPDDFGSIWEAIDAADSVKQQTLSGMVVTVNDRLRRLQTIERQAQAQGRSWMTDARLLTSLASAYAELGELASAVKHYRAALRCDPAHAPVITIEQFALLTVRLAVKQVKDDKDPQRRYTAVAEINDMLSLIESIDQLVAAGQAAGTGSTVERWVLKGSCHKRLAQIDVDQKRDGHLEAMRDAYAEADRLHRARHKRVYPYACLMVVTAEVLLALRSGADPLSATVVGLLEEAEAEAVRQDMQEPSFGNALPHADAALLRRLAEDRLNAAGHREVCDAYLRAWQRGGSFLKLNSVFEQLEMVAGALDGGDDSEVEPRKRLRDAVQAMLTELQRQSQGRPATADAIAGSGGNEHPA